MIMQRVNSPVFILCYSVLLIISTLTSTFAAENISATVTDPGAFTREDSAKFNHYLSTANKYLSSAAVKYESVKAYIDSAFTLCTDRSVSIPGQLYLLSARYSFETGDFSKSEENIILAETAAEESHDYETLAETRIFRGNYHLRTGFFRESSESFNKAIELAEKEKLKKIIPAAYDGLARVMNSAGDMKGYRKYLRLLIKSSMLEPDTTMAESGLLRLAVTFLDKEINHASADSALRKCYSLALRVKDAYYSGSALADIGWNFYLQGKYDSSLYYYERSLKYSMHADTPGYSANSLGNIGNIYRDRGDYEMALKYYSKSIEDAMKVKDWYDLSWVYDDMNKLYLKMGDTSKAYSSFVLFKLYNDSLVMKRSNQGLADARLRYETDNHRKEIDLLSLRLKNNRLLNFGFSGLALLTIIIAFLIIYTSRTNARRRLSEMKRKVSELTQVNLRQQMNPHFIFNTLNSIQYYMYQHDKLATNNYLTKFSNLIRKVLENSQHTTVPLRDELDALKLYLELESLRFCDKFDYSIKIDEEIDPTLYRIPTMIIQPYVENSINHGLMPLKSKGSLDISVSLEDSHLVCIVEDNGIGREAAREIKKAKGTNHNSLGTHITNSRLDLVNSLYGTDLLILYTDLMNSEGKPSGTKVEIQIPISV